MRVNVLYEESKHVGMGHSFRSTELARVLYRRGHQAIATKYDDPFVNVDMSLPDWLVLDSPHGVPAGLHEFCDKRNVKLCFLNGVGHPHEGADADIVWVQDHPDKVIIRKEFTHMQCDYANRSWYVFGGSADPMGLRKTFAGVMPNYPALLTGMKGFVDRPTPVEMWYQPHVELDGTLDSVIEAVSQTGVACIAMGMTAWELAAAGWPQYVFSHSDTHLKFATHLESLGLCRAYPVVGLPKDGYMMEAFLQSPISIPKHWQRPDGLGAERLAEALEEGVWKG